MKLVSWNVNGLRACLNKGFLNSIKALDADIIALQETKMEKGQAEIDLKHYHEYWNSAFKKGYSGTAVFTKTEPKSVTYGIGIEEHDNEGRVITLDFDDFYFVNCYTPNSQRELMRLNYRMTWEDDFKNYLKKLDAKKPVILCGDLNVAHKEIDLTHPKSNKKNAGFTDEERAKMTELLSDGFTDSFRALYPDKTQAYTWWSYMANARAKNVGWRIDYFIVSDRFMKNVSDHIIYPEIYGSDHCPVSIELKGEICEFRESIEANAASTDSIELKGELCE